MDFTPGSLFYGINTRHQESLMYAGDYMFGIVLHPSEDANFQFVMLQSAYIQAYHAYNLLTSGNRSQDTDTFSYRDELFSEDFQKLIQDYIMKPTPEKSLEILRGYDLLTHELREAPTDAVLIPFTVSAYKDALAHQYELVPNNKDYLDNFVSTHFGEQYIFYANQLFTPQEFASKFFASKSLRFIPFIKHPL